MQRVYGWESRNLVTLLRSRQYDKKLQVEEEAAEQMIIYVMDIPISVK
jgi:hypothetical protein